MKIRLATNEDIDLISKIANKNSKELGFVMKVALRESVLRESLIVCEYYDEVVGFCHFRKRKDGITIIYELCIKKEFRGKGLGKMLIDFLPTPIILKCPIDNLSNKFYEHNNFILLRTEKGKKRELNVWKKEKDIIMETSLENQLKLLEEEYEKLKKEWIKDNREWSEIVEQNEKAYQEHLNNQAQLIEKYQEIIDILKRKKVNMFHLWVWDNYEQYKEHYPYSEYRVKEDMLTKEEYEFLKEVLNYE